MSRRPAAASSQRQPVLRTPPTARTHVKGVLALANDGRAVLAGQLARGAHALIGQAADAARVLGVLGHAPAPGGHKARAQQADFDWQVLGRGLGGHFPVGAGVPCARARRGGQRAAGRIWAAPVAPMARGGGCGVKTGARRAATTRAVGCQARAVVRRRGSEFDCANRINIATNMSFSRGISS
jgi:hypothetical protein